MAPAIICVLRPGRALHFILFRFQVHLLLPNKSFPAKFLVGGASDLKTRSAQTAKGTTAKGARGKRHKDPRET